MSKLQEILTTTMQKLGSAVEKVASLSSAGKRSKSKKTGVIDEEGHDFGLIQWDEKQIHSLLNVAERREILPLIPNLSDKKILHLTPGREQYIEVMTKRGGQDLVELDVSTTSVSTQTPAAPAHLYARGMVDHLPLRDDTFDFIMYASALAWRSDLPLLLPEVSRCLKVNGRFLLSTIHPFFEYLMNPRGGFRKSIDTIFEAMKENGFFIEDLKEGHLDDVLRFVSLPPKLVKELQRYQGLPLVLVIKTIRLRKKKAKAG